MRVLAAALTVVHVYAPLCEARPPKPQLDRVGCHGATADGAVVYCVEGEEAHHATPTRTGVLLHIWEGPDRLLRTRREALAEIWTFGEAGPDPVEAQATVQKRFVALRSAKLDARHITVLGKKQGFKTGVPGGKQRLRASGSTARLAVDSEIETPAPGDDQVIRFVASASRKSAEKATATYQCTYSGCAIAGVYWIGASEAFVVEIDDRAIWDDEGEDEDEGPHEDLSQVSYVVIGAHTPKTAARTPAVLWSHSGFSVAWNQRVKRACGPSRGRGTVARFPKLKVTHTQAVEDGDVEQLLTKTTARGFSLAPVLLDQAYAASTALLPPLKGQTLSVGAADGKLLVAMSSADGAKSPLATIDRKGPARITHAALGPRGGRLFLRIEIAEAGKACPSEWMRAVKLPRSLRRPPAAPTTPAQKVPACTADKCSSYPALSPDGRFMVTEDEVNVQQGDCEATTRTQRSFSRLAGTKSAPAGPQSLEGWEPLKCEDTLDARISLLNGWRFESHQGDALYAHILDPNGRTVRKVYHDGGITMDACRSRRHRVVILRDQEAIPGDCVAIGDVYYTVIHY